MIDRQALKVAVGAADPQELLALGAEFQGRALAVIVAPKGAPPEDDRLLDMEEVAKVLGVPEGQARDLGRRGELPVVTVGRYVRVRAASLREWMADRESDSLRTRRAG